MALMTAPPMLDSTGNLILNALDNISVALGGKKVKTTKFAFHYSENDSSPSNVTYPAGYDNSGFTDPFYVDLSTGKPHWGDWGQGVASWLIPKSCMLRYDGTVYKYLQEDNESKYVDGSNSDVANTSFEGNAMMEWGQEGCIIYWKIVPDVDGKGFTFIVANDQIDSGMMPWNHYNCQGEVAEHFYTPKYFGSHDGTRMRSLSGQSNYVNQNAETELSKAKANNQTADEIWNTEVYADWLFVTMLMVLFSKSTDTQAKFGHGRCASSNTGAINTGTMNTKGLFFGSNDDTSGVKIFGMENPYGNLWRRIAGLINANGTVKIKLTYGAEDGSSANGYNLDGTGYLTSGSISGTNGGYISHMNISSKGLTPNTISGSDSTYYCDGAWFNNTQVDYAVVGGYWGHSSRVGGFCCTLGTLASDARAYIGAALSCKPRRRAS